MAAVTNRKVILIGNSEANEKLLVENFFGCVGYLDFENKETCILQSCLAMSNWLMGNTEIWNVSESLQDEKPHTRSFNSIASNARILFKLVGSKLILLDVVVHDRHNSYSLSARAKYMFDEFCRGSRKYKEIELSKQVLDQSQKANNRDVSQLISDLSLGQPTLFPHEEKKITLRTPPPDPKMSEEQRFNLMKESLNGIRDLIWDENDKVSLAGYDKTLSSNKDINAVLKNEKPIKDFAAGVRQRYNKKPSDSTLTSSRSPYQSVSSPSGPPSANPLFSRPPPPPTESPSPESTSFQALSPTSQPTPIPIPPPTQKVGEEKDTTNDTVQQNGETK